MITMTNFNVVVVDVVVVAAFVVVVMECLLNTIYETSMAEIRF